MTSRYSDLVISYCDDGTNGHHVYDDNWSSADHPGWYWAFTEPKGGAYEGELKGPYDTREACLQALDASLNG